MIVFLDSSILGTITKPNPGECRKWYEGILARGAYVVTSAIVDYEVRRGLVLAYYNQKSSMGLERLEEIQQEIPFLPITLEVSYRASQLWAQAQISGNPVESPEKLNADILIAAQVQLLEEEFPGQAVIVATTNIKHLQLFCNAKNWYEISF